MLGLTCPQGRPLLVPLSVRAQDAAGPDRAGPAAPAHHTGQHPLMLGQQRSSHLRQSSAPPCTQGPPGTLPRPAEPACGPRGTFLVTQSTRIS